jgi:hypothetical protein
MACDYYRDESRLIVALVACLDHPGKAGTRRLRPAGMARPQNLTLCLQPFAGGGAWRGEQWVGCGTAFVCAGLGAVGEAPNRLGGNG